MAYAATSKIKFDCNIGSKRMSLLQLQITSYNNSGIPLIPQKAAMGYIDCVIFGGVEGTGGDSNIPTSVVYDRTNNICHLFTASGVEVPDDVDINNIAGKVNLVVIGT